MSNSEVTEILNKYRVIAVVGLSNQREAKPQSTAYMKNHDYKILPVNPTIEEALGEKSYKSLLDIPQEIQRTIDVVDIFRRSEDVSPIVDQAIQLKQKFGRPLVVWMQLDIVNQAAAEKAKQAGLQVVMDKCLMKEHLHRRT